jgi:amino acid permease
LPKCFNATIFRVIFFYIGSALAVSINCPSNAEELLGGLSNAGRSPYIINMNRLLIPALPSLVNGIVFTSIFSTGSSFMFTSSRMLYTLACHGQAPKIFRTTNRFGTPYLAVAVVVLVSCLSYLTLSSQAGVGESTHSQNWWIVLTSVLVWFTNMTTACTLMTWITIGLYVNLSCNRVSLISKDLHPIQSGSTSTGCRGYPSRPGVLPTLLCLDRYNGSHLHPRILVR